MSERLKEQHWKCCIRLSSYREFESPPVRFLSGRGCGRSLWTTARRVNRRAVLVDPRSSAVAAAVVQRERPQPRPLDDRPPSESAGGPRRPSIFSGRGCGRSLWRSRPRSESAAWSGDALRSLSGRGCGRSLWRSRLRSESAGGPRRPSEMVPGTCRAVPGTGRHVPGTGSSAARSQGFALSARKTPSTTPALRNRCANRTVHHASRFRSLCCAGAATGAWHVPCGAWHHPARARHQFGAPTPWRRELRAFTGGRTPAPSSPPRPIRGSRRGSLATDAAS